MGEESEERLYIASYSQTLLKHNDSKILEHTRPFYARF